MWHNNLSLEILPKCFLEAQRDLFQCSIQLDMLLNTDKVISIQVFNCDWLLQSRKLKKAYPVHEAPAIAGGLGSVNVRSFTFKYLRRLFSWLES